MKRIYPIVVILLVAVAMFFIRRSYFQTKSSNTEVSNSNMVLLNCNLLEEALTDSCKMSGNTLECSPGLIKKIVAGVDSTILEDISSQSITFAKESRRSDYQCPCLSDCQYG